MIKTEIIDLVESLPMADLIESKPLTKEEKKEKRKTYYENFKKKHGDKLKHSIICDQCGGHYLYYNKSRHLLKKKHIKSLENKIVIKFD